MSSVVRYIPSCNDRELVECFLDSGQVVVRPTDEPLLVRIKPHEAMYQVALKGDVFFGLEAALVHVDVVRRNGDAAGVLRRKMGEQKSPARRWQACRAEELSANWKVPWAGDAERKGLNVTRFCVSVPRWGTAACAPRRSLC